MKIDVADKIKENKNVLISGENGYSFFPEIELEIDFDKKGILEYQIPTSKEWVIVDAYTFRSLDIGFKRRVNGKHFKGNIYTLGTNEIYREAGSY